MCDPFTLAMMGVSAAATGAGTALGVAGQVKGAKNLSRNTALQLQVAQENADLARKQIGVMEETSVSPLLKARLDDARVRDQVNNVLAGQVGYYSANHLDPAYGSPLVLAGLTAAQGETDAQLVRAQGATEYAGAQSQIADAYRRVADNSWGQLSLGMKNNQGMDAALYGAGTTLLGGITKWAGLAGGTSTGGSPGYYGGSPDTNALLRPL